VKAWLQRQCWSFIKFFDVRQNVRSVSFKGCIIFLKYFHLFYDVAYWKFIYFDLRTVLFGPSKNWLITTFVKIEMNLRERNGMIAEVAEMCWVNKNDAKLRTLWHDWFRCNYIVAACCMRERCRGQCYEIVCLRPSLPHSLSQRHIPYIRYGQT